MQKDVPGWVKTALDLGPALLFFVLYNRIKDETYTIAGTEYSGFIVATLAFVPIILLAIGILWGLTGKLSKLQIFTAFTVIFFGGLTAFFNDERFFKLKTTLVYGFIAALLGIGLLMKRSFLEVVMGDTLKMAHEGWMKFTWRVMIGFAVLAAVNEVVWRTMSTAAWVKIETFGFPIALMVYFWVTIFTLREYLSED